MKVGAFAACVEKVAFLAEFCRLEGVKDGDSTLRTFRDLSRQTSQHTRLALKREADMYRTARGTKVADLALPNIPSISWDSKLTYLCGSRYSCSVRGKMYSLGLRIDNGRR